MSGENDGGRPKPAQKPSFDVGSGSSSGTGPRPLPLPRARYAKPPPSVITAGGVDMARAHASGIRVRNNNAGPALPPDEPRVVIGVETNPRKVPTHRRMLDSRAPVGDGSRAALPPDMPGEATLVSPTNGRRAANPLPNWMRVLIIIVAVALVAGLSHRARTWFTPPVPIAQGPEPPMANGAQETPFVAIPALPEPTASPPAPSISKDPDPVPRAEVRPAPPAPKPAGRVATAAPRGQKTQAAPAKGGFIPPFELPGEKR